jgi:DNA-binding XRE family transcriptional regulator
VRSSVHDVLPPSVRRSLTQFGTDIATARRKRQLTVAMMAERIGVSMNTYIRVEKGNPSVSLGVYAMALFALGLGAVFGDLVGPKNDDQGLLLDEQRLPKRVRAKKEPTRL